MNKLYILQGINIVLNSAIIGYIYYENKFFQTNVLNEINFLRKEIYDLKIPAESINNLSIEKESGLSQFTDPSLILLCVFSVVVVVVIVILASSSAGASGLDSIDKSIVKNLDLNKNLSIDLKRVEGEVLKLSETNEKLTKILVDHENTFWNCRGYSAEELYQNYFTIAGNTDKMIDVECQTNIIQGELVSDVVNVLPHFHVPF